jgi:hypothetical protein
MMNRETIRSTQGNVIQFPKICPETEKAAWIPIGTNREWWPDTGISWDTGVYPTANSASKIAQIRITGVKNNAHTIMLSQLTDRSCLLMWYLNRRRWQRRSWLEELVWVQESGWMTEDLVEDWIKSVCNVVLQHPVLHHLLFVCCLSPHMQPVLKL